MIYELTNGQEATDLYWQLRSYGASGKLAHELLHEIVIKIRDERSNISEPEPYSKPVVISIKGEPIK